MSNTIFSHIPLLNKYQNSWYRYIIM